VRGFFKGQSQLARGGGVRWEEERKEGVVDTAPTTIREGLGERVWEREIKGEGGIDKGEKQMKGKIKGDR
jgi:hypothetical protein